jgi:predicted ATP-dependent serine protease
MTSKFEKQPELIKFAKETVPVIIIGHIQKTGTLGSKILEHMVDTVLLQFEGRPLSRLSNFTLSKKPIWLYG